jgi:ketosteroid isomerase-like protein
MTILRLLAALAMAAATTGSATAATHKPAMAVGARVGHAIRSDPVELARFKRQIRALYEMKERAFAAGDAAAIVNRFYSRDAISVGPEGKPIMGRAEFMEDYKKVVAKYNVKVQSVRTYVKGDNGYDWANFFVTSKDNSEKPFSFVILFLWTRVKGQWVSPGDAYVVGQFPADRVH